MDTIVLFSFFNSNNVGDKAISEIFLQNLSKQYRVVCCSMEGNFHIHHKYVSEKLSIVQKIKRKVYIYAKRPYQSPRYKQFIKEYNEQLENASAIVLGGGNLLMDYSAKTASYTKIDEYIRLATQKGKQCFAFSIGIGPFATEEQLKKAIDTLNACKYISFRDEQSYQLFIDNGGKKDIAHIGMDPVFTLGYDNSNKKTRDAIAVNIVKPYWFGEKYQEKVLGDYTHLVKQLAVENPEKRIVLFTTELNDVEGMEQVYKASSYLKNVYTAQMLTVNELKELYDGSEIVIGARMHSLIIAYACRVPVVGLAWTKKVNSFFDIIHKPKRCLELKDLGDCVDKICGIIQEDDTVWDFESTIEKAHHLLQCDLEEINKHAANKKISY